MLNKPNSITICFVGGDLSKTRKQECDLSDLKNEYLVEFLHRGDKFSGSYNSFSQIINEFVVESNSEFMVFINPKVSPKPDQVEDLIMKLCSGYCWVGRINFGFWATTRELFRNIGLMDERFIGSEWEDNDFMLRLKRFGKAICWEYKYEEYDQIGSPYFGNRGLTRNLFRLKWKEIGDDIFLSPLYSEEKKLPLSIRLNRNYEIFNSWLDSKSSIFLGEPHGVSSHYHKNIIALNNDYESEYSNSTISFKGDTNSNWVEFLCDKQTTIDVFFQNSKNGKLNCWSKVMTSNTWNSDSFFDETEEVIEIKVFHGGDKIYHNKYVKIPFDFSINIGLQILVEK